MALLHALLAATHYNRVVQETVSECAARLNCCSVSATAAEKHTKYLSGGLKTENQGCSLSHFSKIGPWIGNHRLVTLDCCFDI